MSQKRHEAGGEKGTAVCPRVTHGWRAASCRATQKDGGQRANDFILHAWTRRKGGGDIELLCQEMHKGEGRVVR